MAVAPPGQSGGSVSNATTVTTATSTTTTVPPTPEQEFVESVDQQLPTLAGSVNPALTQDGIATLGHDLCDAIAYEAFAHGGPAGASSKVTLYLANGLLPVSNTGGIRVPAISGDNNAGVIRLTVEYLCPQYSS
jgi:hypothetical protein